MVLGIEVEEQLVRLVDHCVEPGVRPVDLVDHHHRRQVQCQRLGQDVTGLGHRSLRGVDQEQHPVDQGERPLHLAPEVGVPGVSTRLIRVSFHVIEAALARMVMPRSRSWSPESITRSTWAWCSANTAVARSMASTSVVLPWSTWAINATFRKPRTPSAIVPEAIRRYCAQPDGPGAGALRPQRPDQHVRGVAGGGIVPGLDWQGELWQIIVIGVIVGLVNAIVKPLLTLLSLPLLVITLGLFYLVVNWAVFALVVWISGPDQLDLGLTSTSGWATSSDPSWCHWPRWASR